MYKGRLPYVGHSSAAPAVAVGVGRELECQQQQHQQARRDEGGLRYRNLMALVDGTVPSSNSGSWKNEISPPSLKGPHLTCTSLSCGGKVNIEELLSSSHSKRKLTTPSSARGGRAQSPRSTSEGSQCCSGASGASSYDDSPPAAARRRPVLPPSVSSSARRALRSGPQRRPRQRWAAASSSSDEEEEELMLVGGSRDHHRRSAATVVAGKQCWGRHRFTDWSSPMSTAPRLPENHALKRLLYKSQVVPGGSLFGNRREPPAWPEWPKKKADFAAAQKKAASDWHDVRWYNKHSEPHPYRGGEDDESTESDEELLGDDDDEILAAAAERQRHPDSRSPQMVRFEMTARQASDEWRRNKSHPAMALSDICYRFTIEEIQQATNNFSNQSKLGEGANGKVYRGVLSSGTECAVKVMVCKDDHSGGFEEEIRFLSMFRHPNLVTLLGFAKDSSRRLLIYEYLAGGDLCTLLHRDQYISTGIENSASRHRHGRQKRSILSWRSRISAALDAAQGLSYLHSRTPKVFHRDVKAANILLDSRGVAKLSDFGLAAYANRDKLTVAKAEGTPGYADPMYMQTLEVSEETEMYSLGMVLMELLTSQSPAVYTSGKRDLRFFIDSVDKSDPHSIMDYVDYECGWPEDIAHEWAQFACRCIHDDSRRRPKSRDVVQFLRRMQGRVLSRKSAADSSR
eukprot:Protomagalhaensia_sp_Gyna_25__4926@NODE_529_length_3205_cov_58_940303_g413_i0_p1_GENE_NODE_529_length_3205_cov_58_940303_g413_i0NODE_529_length_3205_cov_58_940303_g413_i0_p1_ORF_typecomplete_len685_score126_41Pkinase_Tyr/PF07714_17/6_8e60Pkinase/PF00069_25/2_5e03Pkinase/PF00069_25/8_6e53Kinaselike/PF14531_6/1_6e08Pkinase_fungal/PF17667_1/3_2e06Kdo/PF06293_14/0_025Seadorna_VP7/PF07387_11/0_034WaaY/PF06176_11/4_1_NODE_529_length_3205_cov_58_940303_g413_i07112765